MTKPKISSDWMAGCSGCHMSLLDIDERLLEIAELADIRATPITDLKEPDAAGVDVGILEGAVNNSSNEEVAHRMRSRCKVLVALGDCAVFGGARLVALAGVSDLIVVDEPDALLVTHRDRAQGVKNVVDELKRRGRKDLL